MHPELLRALGKARHEDLLNERRTRQWRRVSHDDDSPRFPRSRQRVGSLLIGVGERLIHDEVPGSSWRTNSRDRSRLARATPQ
jgi:hypothetical protein